MAEFAFDKKGRWLALLIDAYGQTGNGVLLRRMADRHRSSDRWTATRPLTRAWPGPRRATALACLKGKEDKAFEDKLYAAVGFTGFVPGRRS